MTIAQLAKELGYTSHTGARQRAEREGWEFTVKDARGTKVYRVPDTVFASRRLDGARTVDHELLDRLARIEAKQVTLERLIQQLLDRERP